MVFVEGSGVFKIERIPKGQAIAHVVWLPYAQGLRVPYAIICLAYAEDFRRRGLRREAYAGSFGTVCIGTAYASLLWRHFLSF